MVTEEVCLSESKVKESLSELGRCGNGQLTFTRLRLACLGLDDISVLTAGFRNVQFIDISENRLKSLEPLQWMISLRELIACE